MVRLCWGSFGQTRLVCRFDKDRFGASKEVVRLFGRGDFQVYESCVTERFEVVVRRVDTKDHQVAPGLNLDLFVVLVQSDDC